MEGRHQSRASHVLRWGAVAAIAIALMGCSGKGDGRARQAISGTVTVDGDPLKGGYLVFEPLAGQATQSGGMIADGQFNVPEKHGAVPGAYSVAIFAEGVAPSTAAEPGTPEYERAIAASKTKQIVIPERYNVKTQLTADVQLGEKNYFEFSLTTK
jgi:hypothetical protein